jgi:glyoxylase-like metal-dependent hydrolase (beta-lactamase superfamily II)
MTKALSPDQSLASSDIEDHGLADVVRPLAEPHDYRGLNYPLGKWVPHAGELHEMAAGVFWLRMPLPMSLDHINLYVLDDGDGVALIDTGLSTNTTRTIWEQLFAGPLAGRKINRVIVTHYHPDHLGLAGWLCEKFDVQLWMSRLEFLTAKSLLLDIRTDVPDEAIKFYQCAGWNDKALEVFKQSGWSNLAKVISPLPSSYKRITGGDVLRIGAYDWTCVPGNGHSPEHICLHQSELGVLISGDQLLPRITSNISVYPTEPDANPLQDWLDSLAHLGTLPENTLILPAHNEPFTGVGIRVQQLIDDHMDKLDRLLEHIKAQPRTAVECFEILFKRKLTGHEFVMGTGEALAHLHYLEKKRLISRRARQAAVEFYITPR